jgi:hypothetical protein
MAKILGDEGEVLKPYDVRRIDGDGNSIGESLGRFDTAEEAWAFFRIQRRDWRTGVFYRREKLDPPPGVKKKRAKPT